MPGSSRVSSVPGSSAASAASEWCSGPAGGGPAVRPAPAAAWPPCPRTPARTQPRVCLQTSCVLKGWYLRGWSRERERERERERVERERARLVHGTHPRQRRQVQVLHREPLHEQLQLGEGVRLELAEVVPVQQEVQLEPIPQRGDAGLPGGGKAVRLCRLRFPLPVLIPKQLGRGFNTLKQLTFF
jgi:hypothetical protein